MSSVKFYRTNFFELVKIHFVVNKQAATWQLNLMCDMAEVIRLSEGRKQALAFANRTLNLSIGKPKRHVPQKQKIRIYWESLYKRWAWLDEEFKQLKSLKRMKEGFALGEMAQHLEAYTNHIPDVLSWIDQYQLDIENSEFECSDEYLKIFTVRLEKAVNVFLLKETLELSSEHREHVRSVTDNELGFLITGIEKDWNEWLAANNNVDDSDGENNSDRITNDTHCVLQLCDPNKSQACLESFGVAGSKLSPIDKKALKKISEQEGIVQLASVPSDYSSILNGFRNRFPNMEELADIIEGQLNLITLGGTNIPLSLSPRPLILDGDAGIGKTMALRYLTKSLGVAFKVVGCAELTNGFDITGQSRGWSSGKMGMIARMILCEQAANGIIVLDEIDKSHDSESNFPPTQGLYTLLEQETSSHFRDEFLDFEMDASKINWLATSNYYEKIRAPIRDRSRRVLIPAPSTQQRISIAKYLYSDLRDKNHNAWGKFFVPELSDGVAFMLASVTGVSVRGMRDVLVECLAKVASEGRRPVDAESQMVTEEVASKVIGLIPIDLSGERPIGFIH